MHRYVENELEQTIDHFAVPKTVGDGLDCEAHDPVIYPDSTRFEWKNVQQKLVSTILVIFAVYPHIILLYNERKY